MSCDANVVHEDVEAAQELRRGVDHAFGLASAGEVRLDVPCFSDPGRASPPARHDSPALACELAHDLEPDPAGRAGDEAALARESEIHGGLG
jgi:hypothetical protein